MLTKLTIRNFKHFADETVEIELGSPVVFIGPNNSGKTSAMQALALWYTGLNRWKEKRTGKSAPEKRPGVAVNRRDLVSIPVPAANLLWHDLRVRDVRKIEGKQRTSNIRIDTIVEGVTNEISWKCGLEFDYANEESFYCRPLRISTDNTSDRMPVPDEAGSTRIAFLPPMSGLAATETHLPPGAVDVLIGEGRTAEVLRNLCYQISEQDPSRWNRLVIHIKNLFGAELHAPRYIDERGEIKMTYSEPNVTLDLSSAGRGLQQTLLLLAYMYANPGAVLLLDEPDAHLEILRQRQIYHLLSEVASDSGSQIIAASHSEVLLNEAAGRDMVIAFVGKPHRIDGRGSQVVKALRDIGFDHYYQAEQTGWVLYLEGSTDLSILMAFARKLGHEGAMRALEKPFVKHVGNQPTAVRRHFRGLREAYRDLLGIVLLDRMDVYPADMKPVKCLIWKKREIENYLCTRNTLEVFAKETVSDAALGPIFTVPVMHESIEEIEEALARLGMDSPWSPDLKASDDFLSPLFATYFKKLGLPNLMAKKSFYELVKYVPQEEIDPEITEKLDAIALVAQQAKARTGGEAT